MKTATVRELRNHYAALLKQVETGEEIEIRRRGKPVALLIAPRPASGKKVDWSKSAAFRQDKSKWPVLTEAQVRSVLGENKGNW